MTDPFLILGVPFDADDDTIEAAYLAGLRRASPERDPAGFEALRGAYKTIRTRRDRLAYALFDQTPPSPADILAKGAPPGQPRRPKRATLTALLRGEV